MVTKMKLNKAIEELKAIDARRKELRAFIDGEIKSIGGVVSWGAGDESEVTQMDWRDLRVGDVIVFDEFAASDPTGAELGVDYPVDDLQHEDLAQPVRVDGYWPSMNEAKWRLVRRA